VIVDGPPNSIPPELTTLRQTNVSIIPMNKEAIESIPEFSNLIDFLMENKLDTACWNNEI
jgi:hypothetical protein